MIISRILLLLFIYGCDGGYFASRNHTRRSYYRYFKEQSDKRIVTTVLPVTSGSTLNALDIRKTSAVTTTVTTTPEPTRVDVSAG